jgi:hypothetical protein
MKAVEATVAQQVWRDGFGEMAGLVAGCFPRRETRQTFREMTEAMLMGVARANCLPFCEPPSSARPAATWRTPCTRIYIVDIRI